MLRQVALVADNAPNISASDLAAASAALQKQATRDFGPLWEVDATVDAFPSLADVPIGYWPIIVRADIGDPNALGFHLDPQGQPLALVEATDQWALTASHECLEMLADPTGFRLVAGPSIMPGQGRVEYLVEVADPCEDPNFAYTVNGVLVSDFVTPAFFDPVQAGSVRYDFGGQISQPRQVLSGGYLTWHDPTTDHWWQLRRFGEDQFVDLGVLDRQGQSLRGMIDRVTHPPRRVQGVAAGDPRLEALAVPGVAHLSATRSRAAALRRFITTISTPTRRPRAGLPEPSSVFARSPLTTHPQYRILATTERDPKDAPGVALAPDARESVMATRAGPESDNYAGSARMAAKLSIASAAPQDFADVKALIDSLPPDSAMKDHDPPITTEPTQDRVNEENHNVRLPAWIYAASREADNDFHLIIGRDPSADPTFMTAEVSGLPPADAGSLATLQAARDAYKQFFGNQLPQQTYDFYDPPIPIHIEGSTFWDATHATGNGPGPHTLKPHMPCIWEIHPITSITFEPAAAGA